MREWLSVAAGGMLGALGRHAIATSILQLGPAWALLGTLIANVLGCFAIGYLFAWSVHSGNQNQWVVVGIRVGLLGGLTTFSSFALELVRTWYEGRLTMSVALLLAHVALGVTAVLIGAALAGGVGSTVAAGSSGSQSAID